MEAADFTEMLVFTKLNGVHIPEDFNCSYAYPSEMCHYLLILTLVDLQLDVQNSYLFTYNTFIKILYMFRALPCSSSGGLRSNCIYAASGIVITCRE